MDLAWRSLAMKTQYTASEIGNVYSTPIFLCVSDKHKRSARISKTLFSKERNFHLTLSELNINIYSHFP